MTDDELRAELVQMHVELAEVTASIRRRAVDRAGFPADTPWGQLVFNTYDDRVPLHSDVDDQIADAAVRQFARQVWGITPDTVTRHQRRKARA